MGVSTTSSGTQSLRTGTHGHGFHPLRIRRVVRETSDAVSLVLEIPDELRERFHYQAGQFVTFRMSIDGQQQLRSYSMSSSPQVDAELAVTVKRVPGGAVSNWILETLGPGDVLETTRPAGVFCLGPGDGEVGDVIAFAAGSGITPVYSVLKTALTTTPRRVRLLYANRDRLATIFASELDALAAAHADRFDLVHHFDTVNGFVDAAAISRHLAAGDAAATGEYFICGPAPFMDLVEDTLHANGINADRIHIERFAALEPTPDPAAEAAPGAANDSVIQVTIELDGRRETTQHRAGMTILQTARQAGLSPPFSCEAGDCATCMARIVEGSAQMRSNNALYDDEVADGWVLTCQAVPDSPAVHVVYGED